MINLMIALLDKARAWLTVMIEYLESYQVYTAQRRSKEEPK